MKRNLSGLWAIVTVGSLMAFGAIARADDTSATKPSAPASPGAGQRPSVEDRLKKMAEDLKLTDDQKTKIKPLLKDQMDKLSELFKKSDLSREEKTAQFKKLREDLSKKLKDILTPEQFTKWEKNQEAQIKRLQNRQTPPAKTDK